MASDAGREAGKWALVAAAAAAGIAFVALPWLPQQELPALPERFALATPTGRALLSALQWHDAACVAGDLEGFGERVTADYAKGFARRLETLGRRLDGDALRAYVGPDGSRGLARAVERDCRGGFADGERACFVAAAPQGQRGVLGVLCCRDDGSFRLEAVVHQPAVDPGDAAGVAAFARRLLDGD
jgi:hypothetical protein